MNEWDIKSFEWIFGEDSVVVELGGYKGRWALEIATRYNPNLFVFEPQVWAFDICKVALSPWPRTHVYNYGLGLSTGVFPMGRFETDGCSFVETDMTQAGMGEMKEIVGAFDLLKIESIDLLMMNIEGYEFQLIPYLLQTRLLSRIKNLCVQFHSKFDVGHELDFCLSILNRQFDTLWDYGTSLSGWQRRNQ